MVECNTKITSTHQSGGITANEVNANEINLGRETRKNASKKSRKPLIAFLTVVALIVGIASQFTDILSFFGLNFSEQHMTKDNSNINNTYVSSHYQSGGITAGTINVNQQRKIIASPKIEKKSNKSTQTLRVILSQTSGIWDSGTNFQMHIKLSGPYETAKLTSGFPGGLQDAQEGENKSAGEYFFSTATAPIANQLIIFEIDTPNGVEVTQFSVAPASR